MADPIRLISGFGISFKLLYNIQVFQVYCLNSFESPPEYGSREESGGSHQYAFYYYLCSSIGKLLVLNDWYYYMFDTYSRL